MFGHVDAGVLHVRPALDLIDPEQEKLMHQISDQVVALVAKYGGLMWGEHGKGYRSEYGPEFFGDFLYTELRKIKAAFDPYNQMNPGKICTPLGSNDTLVSVKDAKRATLDRTIPIAFKEEMAPAMSCNGNGLCFNYDTKSPMCPSSKITSDRRHTPKGRAGIIREWLRLLAKEDVDANSLTFEQFRTSFWSRFKNTHLSSQEDFSHEVLEVMNGCLACKSCTSQCPVNVDVPDFRARFLSIYYQRYSRPMKDLLVANVESMTPLLAKLPKFINQMIDVKPVSWFLENKVGYVDTPKLSVPTLTQRVATDIRDFDLTKLRAMPEEQRKNVIAIVQDPFTSFYDAPVVESLANSVKKLGYTPLLLPFKPNGKPAHVKGFLAKFAKQAKDMAEFLNVIHDLGITLIGADASLVLVYRDEYNKILGDRRGDFFVQTCHEWLADVPQERWPNREVSTQNNYSLVAHCTEKTALPKTEKTWQMLLEKCGAKLDVISAGCCGMAGTYGHEKAQLENSKGIYNLSWSPIFKQYKPSEILATGFSCRSQVARIEGSKPKHPIQILEQLL
jgi:Fe-S oxidoreductase